MSPLARRRGQTLALLALTMLLVVAMAFMTISITMRVRQKLELQTVVDVAAYNDAVSTARTMNEMGLLNRTIVSHWVVMLGIQANMAFGSMVPAYFDTFADTFEKMRWPEAGRKDPRCPNNADEKIRQRELQAAATLFKHASYALWSGQRPSKDLDPILAATPQFPAFKCPGCFTHLPQGLGQLDRQVTQETKEVRTAVRDLVEVQKDLRAQLQDTLRYRSGATQVAAAARGQPFSPAAFPYAIERGAPVLPPGWREADGALASTRTAMDAISHAAMGTRGNRFVMSGSRFVPNNPKTKGDYDMYRPYRVETTVRKIQRILRAEFPADRFTLAYKTGLLATWMERGSDAAERDGDMNPIDDGALEDIDSALGPDVPTDDDENEPPDQESRDYDVNVAWRITPAREIGIEYVSGKQTGDIYITYNGPCGTHSRTVNVFAYSRVHADNGTRYTESQHSWMEGKKHRGQAPGDGSRNYWVNNDRILHGVNRGTDGYEENGHIPNRFFCHPWHRHPGEVGDDQHSPGPEIDDLGIMPGGFGFLFPQDGPDPVTGVDRNGAYGAFGQPKTPVLMTRANSGPGVPLDPWNLKFNFKFGQSGPGSGLDLEKSASDQPMAALSTGMAYYHRRCPTWQGDRGRNRPPPRGVPNPAGCISWQEPPNLLNPFWHATLVPIDVDEDMVTPGQARTGDATPGDRKVNEARRMLKSSGPELDPAAETVRLLQARGYQGIQ